MTQSVCDLIKELAPADTAAGEETAPGVPRPTPDLNAIRASLAVSPPATTFPPAHPLTGAQMGVSTTPGETPFSPQDPIYLLPAQAQAQGQFLVAQQSQSVLGIFLRRVLNILKPQSQGA
jgi:hypothetical protein